MRYIGFILSPFVAILTWFGVWLFSCIFHSEGLIIFSMLIAGPLAALVTAIGTICVFISIERAQAKEKEATLHAAKQHQDHLHRIAAQKAASERAWTAMTIAKARKLAAIKDVILDAQATAAKLPALLKQADLYLDLAEDELAERVPSSFWEAMENAALYVNEFEETLQSLDAASKRHRELSADVSFEAPAFDIGTSLIPEPSSTNARLVALFRKAQKVKDKDFVSVYELRRINTTLIENFRTLGDAIGSFAVRLQSSIDALSSRVSVHLTDVETALRDSSDRLLEQQQALIASAEAAREEMRHTHDDEAALARESAERDEKAAKDRKQIMEMLDNMQRRRFPLDRSSRENEY